MTEEQPAIETQGLTKRFGEVTAPRDLDLRVEVGEVFGFLGPNGAGKSTTIKLLLDQARPSEGSARVLGLDVREDSLAVRRRIGYVPGDLALYPKLTGAETLRYFARLRGGVDEGHVQQLAKRLGADLEKRVGAYSTGNRQKIGLIQAFMHRPELLVLDEPNAGLDPLVQQEFHAMVREAREDGRTVFLSSHTLSEVERVADRVGIIRHGELAAVESIHDLKAKAVRRLELEFAGRAEPQRFEQLDGVREVTAEERHLEIAFEGSITPILEAAMEHEGGELVDLRTKDADLEEIFLAYYDDAPAQERAADG